MTTNKKYIAIKPTKKIANDIIKSWPLQSQIQVKDLLKRYGAPDEVTPSLLIWYNRGPWIKTIVYKEQVIHNWPAKHSDILEQYISYKIPINKYDDLAKYDGSVWAERTKGVLAARCHLVPMNFVAINIAHELIHDRLTVKQARAKYVILFEAVVVNNKRPLIARKLMFKTMKRSKAMDKDKIVLDV